MESISTEKITTFLKKYRYALLVLAIGMVLMSLPEGKSEKPPDITHSEQTKNSETSLCEELEMILSEIKGAGKVKVLLTVGRGEITFYQENSDRSGTEPSSSQRTETVIITDRDRNESGLIKNTVPETYRGAVILCDGADQPSIKLDIVEAVSKVTGLSSDKICVLKIN